MTLKLTFLGGAGTVTGSKYWLSHKGGSLLVDCGLFQGYKFLRLRNWALLPLPAAELNAVLLTHAHLDHSGYLPLLVGQGFSGPVYCTEATRDLCEILLPDSGRLQEQDAEFANRHGFSRHHPALPLYTEEDARRCLKLLRPVPFGRTLEVAGASIQFLRAGHILGASSIVVEAEGTRLGFSGDIGRYDDPMMPDPETPTDLDYLLIESTYGNRLHSTESPEEAIATIISRTCRRGGTIVIPAFAVGRAQSVLFHIARLKAAGRLPALLPVYLDSPMAIDATELLLKHKGQHRLGPQERALLADHVTYVRSSDESKALTASTMPKVVISASGMATGGRILHHLKHYAPDPRNAIIFTGFQASGTRGAAMVQGAKSVRIHGHEIPIAAEIHSLEMLSAHADEGELLRWASSVQRKPLKTFVVHGEPGASDALRRHLQERLGWDCHVPEHREQVTLRPRPGEHRQD